MSDDVDTRCSIGGPVVSLHPDLIEKCTYEAKHSASVAEAVRVIDIAQVCICKLGLSGITLCANKEMPNKFCQFGTDQCIDDLLLVYNFFYPSDTIP